MGLTRGRGDARLYMVRRRDLMPSVDQHAGLPPPGRRGHHPRGRHPAAGEPAGRAPGPGGRPRRPRGRPPAGLPTSLSWPRWPWPATTPPPAWPGGPTARRPRPWRRRHASTSTPPSVPASVPVPRAAPSGESGTRRWDGWPPIGPGGEPRPSQAGPVPVGRSGRRRPAAPPGAVPGGGRGARGSGALDVGAWPTVELADERRALQRALAATPAPAQLDHAHAALVGAQRGLVQAQAERAEAAERLEQLGGCRGRRRNHQGIEMARQSLQRADQRNARAEVEVERAEAPWLPSSSTARDKTWSANDWTRSRAPWPSRSNGRLLAPPPTSRLCWASPPTTPPRLRPGARPPRASRPIATGSWAGRRPKAQ